MRVFYFGTWGGPGHYIWTPSAQTERAAGPWTARDLDARSYELQWGRLTPTGRGFVPVDSAEEHHVWRLTRGTDDHGAPWTALGCYDRTQDRRKGSVSVFVAEGEHDEAEMRAIAEQHFPRVWARILGGAS